jgi:hypothetical protein
VDETGNEKASEFKHEGCFFTYTEGLTKWWNYWLELQAKHDILPREANFKPSSAFDVRAITGQNVKAIANYLTYYVTKNDGEFKCQIWNCSKKISRLKTNEYSTIEFLERVEALEKANLLGGERKMYVEEYCTTHVIPMNRITLNLYSKIDKENKLMWNRKEKEIQNGNR